MSEPATGRVYLVDPARLTRTGSADLKPGMTILAGGAGTYALDAAAGRVQRLAPDDLADDGPALQLPPPLGGVAQTDDGTLWVPLRSTGAVAAVRDGAAVPLPRQVADPGNAVDIVLAGGRPVAVDATAGTLTLIAPLTGQPTAPGRSIALPRRDAPPGPAPAPAPSLLAAPRTEDGPVPVVDPASRRLFLVDVDAGTATAVDLPGTGRPGSPLAHAGHAYVPVSDLGIVLDYDLDRGVFGEPVRVAATGGQARLTVTVDDGQVWINDAAGPDAVLINDRGRVLIAKQPPDLPGLPTGSARPLPAPPPLPDPERTHPSGRGGHGPVEPTTARPATAGTPSPRTSASTGMEPDRDQVAEPTALPRPTPSPTAPPPPTPPPPPPPPSRPTVTVPPSGTPRPSPTLTADPSPPPGGLLLP
ncbi:hypothetical protein [Frankia sp. EI5c]|uniref:hypothetical protein n=1 Tax=Frankia sp. EI5c TaxID=683316 RepID=UPI001F5B271A|nr:hypothetical protein [Frankia sp. EI5c]